MSALTYVIFILVAVTACLLGAVAAYFYYQARHREAKAVLEALDQDISEREEKLHRLQFQLASTQSGGGPEHSNEAATEIQRLRQALEQKQNDYDLLKHDFDLEIDILKREVEQIRNRKAGAGPSTNRSAELEAELRKRGEILRGHAEALRERAEAIRDRETTITDRERSIAAREKEIEEEVAAREKQIEEEVAARRQEIEMLLAERLDQLQAEMQSIGEERATLARSREALAEKESRIDAELIGLPTERFTREQEAILIKRLRQQNKQQRDELEKLHREVHRAKQQLASAGKAAENEGATGARTDNGRLDRVLSGLQQTEQSPDDQAHIGMGDGEATVSRAGTTGESNGEITRPKVAPDSRQSDTLESPTISSESTASAPIASPSPASPALSPPNTLTPSTLAPTGGHTSSAETSSGETLSVESSSGETLSVESSSGESSSGESSSGETSSGESAAAAPAGPETEPEAVVSEPGERYDDLTRLPGLDGGLQQELYRRGIRTYDQIARWSSAEVRYVAEHLGIDRKTIQDHWIVNAQSHVFAKDPPQA